MPGHPDAILDKLDEEMGALRQSLETQFTRIAQMQQQIDELRAALRNHAASR